MKDINLRLKEPFVMLLIGPPLVGKTTWVNNNYPDTEVISRDEIVMELFGSRDYEAAFKRVDQKKVDEILIKRIRIANKNKDNVIIDMTHMSSKRRRIHLNYFSDDYYKVGVIFPFLDKEEYIKRNTKRYSEEKKFISMGIVKKMVDSFQNIKEDEGFDKVISL